jgi:type IV pilus assembly protein PilE
MQKRIHRAARGPKRSGHGFTLIELMIAVVVVAILAAVAMPTFMDSIRKSRRSEAFAALASLQQAQERWRANNALYTATLTDLNVAGATKYYDLTVSGPSANAADRAFGYIATAVGKAGTSQGDDAQCRKLSVWVDKGSIKYAGCGSCSSFTYSPSNECWSR